MGSHHSRVKVLLAFGAIYFIWGSTFLAIRFAVQTLPPLLTMGTRHLVAGTLLFALLAARGIRVRPEPGLWRPAFFSGACCFLGCHGLLAWAEIRIDSGLAALLSSTLPIWMLLLARVRGQESELNPRVLSGIALGFAGVAVLIPMNFTGPQPDGLRALAILAAEILWAVGAIYARGVKSTPGCHLCGHADGLRRRAALGGGTGARRRQSRARRGLHCTIGALPGVPDRVRVPGRLLSLRLAPAGEFAGHRFHSLLRQSAGGRTAGMGRGTRNHNVAHRPRHSGHPGQRRPDERAPPARIFSGRVRNFYLLESGDGRPETPHFSFGCGPRRKRSTPPFTISS